MTAAPGQAGMARAIAFMVFLGGLAALPPLSIDMALPALGAIGRALHTGPSQAGLTLSLFMAGFVIGPPVYGPLSDAFGRRRLLLPGMAIFTAGGVAAALAPSIAVLLIARFCQGLGAGAGMTLALAIVRDRFDGAAMQRRLAAITVVANLAPIVAPTLGVALLPLIHWRGIYGVMAACGLAAAVASWAGLSESSRPAVPSFSTRALLRDTVVVLRHRGACAAIAVNALGFGWMFAWVAGSPLVLPGLLHMQPGVYAAWFGATGLGIVAGAGVNGIIAARGVPGRRLLAIAAGLALTAAASLSAAAVAGLVTTAIAMPLFMASTFSFGLAAPSAARAALDPLQQLSGVAGGLLTSAQMLAGAASSSLVALLFPTLGLLAVSGVMAICALLAMAAVRRIPH